jgi:hypothetical protein
MMDLTKVPLNEYGHVQTREGRPVRLLCVDAESSNPVLGLLNMETHECINSWKSDGTASLHPRLDLVPVPRKRTVSGWLCVSKNETSFLFSNRPAKETVKGCELVAMKEIAVELTEGEGL